MIAAGEMGDADPHEQRKPGAHRTVTVITAGPAPVVRLPPEPGFVIAADGGAATALGAGVVPDLVVGDLDSLPADARARLERERVAVERHPAEKDETDFELALHAALVREPDRLVVVGSAGGRLDHLFGLLTTLAGGVPAGVEVDALLGAATVHVVRGARRLTGRPGELVSLFALGEAAEGVRTTGLRYPLRDEPLQPGTSRGVSNEFAAERAEISLTAGVLLVIRPGTR